MTAIKDLKISAKLTLIMTATAAIALVCVVVAFFVQDLQLVKKVKSEQVESQLAILSANIAHSLVHDDAEATLKLLKSTVSVYGIVTAKVVDASGNVLFQLPGEVPSMQSQPEGYFFPNAHYSRLISEKGRMLGRLEVSVSHKDLETRLLYLMAYSAIALGLAILIAIAMAMIVQRIISRPLIALQALTQKVIETGNYGLRSELVGKDELGQLGAAINTMLDQIEQRDLKMEKQVSRRTRELKKLAEDFRYRALHDTLTGLPNRALLNEEFFRAVAHANRVNKGFAVLMLDLDNFKAINDTYGHDLGDELLKNFSITMKDTLRGEDVICRLGGDEFVVLLEDIEDEKQVLAVGKSLLSVVDKIRTVRGRRLDVGVSIGAAMYPQHGETIDELKRNADIAMYCAKEGGKNCLVIYQNVMGDNSISKTVLHNDLKAAFGRKQFELHYQPQIDEVTKQLIGCEAVLRWRHHSLGMIKPADFIPVAEDSGLIKQIDYFVIRKATRQWQMLSDSWQTIVPVSINLSAVHFNSAEIVKVIKQALDDSALPASRLILELPESALINTGVAENIVGALKKMGVKIALDDFGVGHSSLQVLRNWNLDRVKLDSSLGGSLNRDAKDRYLTKGIIALTKEIGVELVAEGIELPEQVSVLRGLGCHLIQGYVYAPPLPRAKLMQWMKHYHKNGNNTELRFPEYS